MALLGCLMLAVHPVAGQSVSFFHVTTENGLSDNNVSSLAVDKNGFLWIGTREGLNVFDGYSVMSYYKKDQSQLASNDIIHLTRDSRNRIWAGTPEGITWVDDQRNFHRVVLNDTVSRFASRSILDTRSLGPVLFTSLGQYYFNEKNKNWERLRQIPEQLRYDLFNDAEPFGGDTIIYATRNSVMLYDYSNARILFETPVAGAVSVCRYSDHEIAVALRTGILRVYDFTTGALTKQLSFTRTVNDKPVTTQISEIRAAINGSILVATDQFGLATIDRRDSITYYVHDAVNRSSISSNMTIRVLCDADGNLISGSSITGVNIIDLYNRRVGYTDIFHDGKGHFFDNYIADITEDRDGILWLGAFEKIVAWDKRHEKARFYDYSVKQAGAGMEIRAICVDSTNRVWAGVLGNGLSILDKNTGQYRPVFIDSTKGQALRSNIILDLMTATDGTIWASTLTGIFTINPKTLAVTTFDNHPLLKELNGRRINYFLLDHFHRIWMATAAAGVYCFDQQRGQLLHYSQSEGLSSARCYALGQDRRNNIYVGTAAGFTIIAPDGRLTSYSQKDGLPYDRCDGVLEDDQGGIWVSNVKCLVLFDPQKGTLRIYDQNMGLNGEGFRPGAFIKTSRGELIWGCRKGINYFFPDKLTYQPKPLNVTITQSVVNDSTFYLSNNGQYRIPYAKNRILFRFTAINLQGSQNIQYRFRLIGHDEDWQQGVDIREARYSHLPAGNYTFRVQASINGVEWVPAMNEVAVTVVPPLYRQPMFIILCAVIFSSIVLYAAHRRTSRLRQQREELETEQAIRHFASSMSEQQTEEDILWDVVRNCMSRLHIEDCVIYLKEEGRDVFVQKAANGPKRQPGVKIIFPREINAGSGIVGTVGVSGQAEIIRDTRKDRRYVKGVVEGRSEITVPMVYNDTVMGVIDCEHSRKGFFKQKHLSILTTIASLCANKIVRARVEEQKRKTEAILMDTQQKMTEVEMQALRAQMNPHFIFNCLNSINRYIVKSEQATASLYLTKFAKLIRLILDNSNSKNVILTNELEALKLYIEMEALRFDKKFTYEVKVEGHLSTDSVEVPPLIIQPYVENAIWHGLLHKETNGHLSIRVSLVKDSVLRCVIEDNGVGRRRARELKSKSATSRKSLGMELTENRLSLLNKHAELNASVEIIDMETATGEPAGTKVVLSIPV